MKDDLTSLRPLLAAAEAEEQRLLTAREQLDAELARARERADLLRRLVGLSSAARPTPLVHGSKPEVRILEHAQAHEAAGRLEEHVQQILESAGAPVHISKIRQALVDAGVPLPGRGNEANIIVRLARATDRFVRTGRGTYGLKSLGAAEVHPTRTTRRRRVAP